jgi:hypothetical protein
MISRVIPCHDSMVLLWLVGVGELGWPSVGSLHLAKIEKRLLEQVGICHYKNRFEKISWIMSRGGIRLTMALNIELTISFLPQTATVLFTECWTDGI